MKKLISILCAVILCFSFAGCNSSEETASSQDGLDSIVEMVSGENKHTREPNKEEPGEKVAVGTSPWKPEDITSNPDLDCDGDEGMVSEGRLYFPSASSNPLLVDSEGSLTWLYSTNREIFAPFDSGDYVRVGHGMIMESYPGQTYISKIALIEDGDIWSFTDEEWARLSEPFVDPPTRE